MLSRVEVIIKIKGSQGYKDYAAQWLSLKALLGYIKGVNVVVKTYSQQHYHLHQNKITKAHVYKKTVSHSVFLYLALTDDASWGFLDL